MSFISKGILLALAISPRLKINLFIDKPSKSVVLSLPFLHYQVIINSQKKKNQLHETVVFIPSLFSYHHNVFLIFKRPNRFCCLCHNLMGDFQKCRISLKVTQLCLTCDPMDCSPPGSSVHGIFQARILEWVAISFSRGSSRPRNWTRVSCITGSSLLTEL